MAAFREPKFLAIGMCQTTYTTFGMRTRPIVKCRCEVILLIHQTAVRCAFSPVPSPDDVTAPTAWMSQPCRWNDMNAASTP